MAGRLAGIIGGRSGAASVLLRRRRRRRHVLLPLHACRAPCVPYLHSCRPGLAAASVQARLATWLARRRTQPCNSCSSTGEKLGREARGQARASAAATGMAVECLHDSRCTTGRACWLCCLPCVPCIHMQPWLPLRTTIYGLPCLLLCSLHLPQLPASQRCHHWLCTHAADRPPAARQAAAPADGQ